MKNLVRNLGLLLCGVCIMTMFSCGKKSEQSSKTGWNHNDPEWGGYEVVENPEQETGPGLVYIPGGTFMMGNVEQDVNYEFHSIPKRVTVTSFYMDETEVTNSNYREYLYWLQRIFGESYPELIQKATPDTLVWYEELAYNEPLAKHYLRHPAYNDYPVVGVNWLQANEYCKWRTDRVNERALIEKNILDHDPNQFGAENFNTEAYLLGQYEGVVKDGMPNLDPNGEEVRKVRFEDGILHPDYRLPTEAEWEYAALAILSDGGEEERFTDRKIYPWEGTSLRYAQHGKWHGDMLANYKRGRGDYMGIAGNPNDNAEVTAPVATYAPNDFGLYNMAGNVSEWTLDVYRPMTFKDMEDFNPFRGNVFKAQKRDEEGKIAPKDSLGRIQYEELTEDQIGNRPNFRKANVINYRDGDEEEYVQYETDKTTLISDKSRVTKGGSWSDVAFYLSPGTRRYMDEDNASATLGFRCAMISVGSSQGKAAKGFTKGKPKTKSYSKNRK
ncbi:MAG: SUMF1/EgtB/PvdO family nonheme iron enzyme [Chitinophagales bacterium]